MLRNDTKALDRGQSRALLNTVIGKSGIFLEWLSDFQLLKKELYPMNYLFI
jgi:hypothetical protein